jgi:Bacterial type II/III secretion system short domain.
MKLKSTLFVFLSMLLLSGIAMAEPADAGHALSVHTFAFKFKDAEKAAAAIKSLISADGSMSIQPASNSLVVTDRADNLKAISKALADFDTDAQMFRLSVRIVSAARVEGAAPKIADDLKDVAQKLALFRYNSFENSGEANVVGKEGDNGLVDMATGYRADFRFGEYDPASDSIKVNDFHLSRLQGPQKDQLTSLLKTSLNLRLGQTYIVGATKAPQSQRALMIVLVAHR